MGFMANLERYRMRLLYKGIEGLAEIGFKKRDALLPDLFPTADEIVLSIAGCFYRLDQAAAIISEIPEQRFEVVETGRVLELALPDPKGDYVGLIVNVLAGDRQSAESMLADVEATCGFVRARMREALGIMEITEAEYLQRLKEDLKLMATELKR